MDNEHAERHSSRTEVSPALRTPTYRPLLVHETHHHAYDAYDEQVADEIVRDYLHYRHLHNLDGNHGDPLDIPNHHHHLQQNQQHQQHQHSHLAHHGRPINRSKIVQRELYVCYFDFSLINSDRMLFS